MVQIKGGIPVPGSGTVQVGVLPGSGKEPDGIDLATLAQVLHDGSSLIPPRPFIRQPLESKAMQDEITRLSTRVLEGKLDETVALRRIGETARGHILDAINARPYAPNAPSTIARKGSDLPLVDKAILKGAIAYRVLKGLLK